MDQLREFEFTISDNLIIQYMETDHISNIFINNKEKNLLTKSSKAMTFKGFLNLIAFYSQSDHYTIDYNGIIIYNDIIYLDDRLYFQLEDTLEYYDETTDDISKDYDENMQVTLYYRDTNNDLEIASFDLEDYIVELVYELDDFYNKTSFQSKLFANSKDSASDIYKR